MSSTLKLSEVQTQSSFSEELAQAQAEIEELKRQLAVQRQANVNMATKVNNAREMADQTLVNENSWLHKQLDELQNQRQLEALEALVSQDSKATKATDDNKALRKELGDVKKALKALQALEPEKLKKNVATQKKKIAEQTATIKDLDRKLKLSSKELSQVKKELEEANGKLAATESDSEEQAEA